MRNLYLVLVLGSLFATPLLLGQEEEPLLLLEEEAELAEGEDGGADNSRCHVCHLNFAREEIAVTHARQDIGCVACHGDCDVHIDDESWASGGPGTPPGIMFPPEAIDAACGKCHDAHDVPPRAVLARARERELERMNPIDITCTDCHGYHRLKAELRNAWWDKRTGKPIQRPKAAEAKAK